MPSEAVHDVAERAVLAGGAAPLVAVPVGV
jgi:hypothetical protein